MSSRRRLYLNLKQSITKLFKTPAHYLKEITGKQSIYEKPYFDDDYRAMHLRLPNPWWKKPSPSPGPSPWPPPRKHTFVFDDGICSLSGQSGECGETISLSGWLGLVPLGSEDRQFSWVAQSSNPTGASIEGISTGLSGMSASIRVKLGDSFTGTVTICAQATMISGSTLKEIAYLVPSHLGGIPTVPGWIPSLGYAMKNLPPMYEVRGGAESWNCGCVDLEVTCCDDSGMAWAGPETINRNESKSVSITDSLGTGGPYTWTVTGTGFTLDYAETTGLSNTLNADNTACGPAIINVTGCDGNVVSGDVLCSEGQWSGWTTGCKLSGSGNLTTGAGVIEIIKESGRYYQQQQVRFVAIAQDPCNQVNCNPDWCASGACLDDPYGCAECLEWACSDYSNYTACQRWCCIPDYGSCDELYGCMCNYYFRWKEWIC